MGITVATTDLPIVTFCAWQTALHKASDEGIAWHPGWNDLWTFLADNGPCPDGGRLACESKSLGYVPGNTFWIGTYAKERPTFAECPIAVKAVADGVLNEQAALRLAYVDADIDIVRNEFEKLDLETVDKTPGFRREAFNALVESLEADYEIVPIADPNRWQIAKWSTEIWQEYMDSQKEPDDDEVDEFEGDPRNSMVLNLSRVGLARHALR